MLDDDLWQVVKAAVEWLFLPLVGAITYFFRKYIQRVEMVEKRISSLEIRLAVVENNIAHIKDDIEQIKKGIEKILERV